MDNIKQNDYIKDLISVIIPSYNRYELLNHSIQSVLNNSYKNIEIIVINDCSTDERYYNGQLEKYEKTKIIHLPENQKIKYNILAAQGITRNYGLEQARGEWIAFLDDDDFYFPLKIEIQLRSMKQNNSLFSSTNMNLINHNKINIDKLDFNIIRPYFKINTIPTILTKEIIEKDNYINNSSVIIHRSIVDKVGKFNPIKCEDWDYWKRALYYTNCYYIDIILVNYTFTINNSKNQKFYIYK